jgi:hypothetical protein
MRLSLSLTLLITLSFSLILVPVQGVLGQAGNLFNEIVPSPLSIFSVRNIPSLNPLQLAQQINFTLTKFGGSCPPEIAIYIHGWNKDQNGAGEEFNRLQTSLRANNYTGPLIGFSWISNTDWQHAQHNAKDGGGELAKFIGEFKKPNWCPSTHIYLLAHSLGAAVVESTLVGLHSNPISTNNTKVITSVHLLGAAINNKLIAKNTLFGDAIEHVTNGFYNLFSSKDDGLEFNKLYENGILYLGPPGVLVDNKTLYYHPLGLEGAPSFPANYVQRDVANEIPALSDADGDGNIEECFEEYKPALEKGDNHCGYIGFREPFSHSLIDDGVVNIIVGDWKNVSP